MRPFVSITAVLTAMMCFAQTSSKKSSPKPSGTHSSFVCPDPEAQKACKSYEELLKSKDPGLASEAYVCFRKNEDEFFVIRFSKPYFSHHWDKDLKEMVVDSESTVLGIGFSSSYKDGVESPTTIPSFMFSGKWLPFPESGTFTSDKIDGKQQDEKDNNVGIAIYDTQINIGYKYTNRFEKTIQYNLTLQRSTGRFVESFQSPDDKLPFLESTGYCSYHKTE